jgi:hypothetical protein
MLTSVARASIMPAVASAAAEAALFVSDRFLRRSVVRPKALAPEESPAGASAAAVDEEW